MRTPKTDAWGRLKRVLRYVCPPIILPLNLRADSLTVIKWWVDASYTSHTDMRGHMGDNMSFVRGSITGIARKKNINAKISMEAEIIGANNAMPQMIWTRHFI